MKDSKKAQAALEFLMTYGWAVLVVLVVIGTLAYFGILNPSALLPEKCTLQMGLYCKDHRIDGDTAKVSLRLENGMGKGLIIRRIKIGDPLKQIYCDAGVGNYTGMEPYDGCRGEGDCGGCNSTSEWYYMCNDAANGRFRAAFNSQAGWRLGNGEQGDITVHCQRMTQSEGKTKVSLSMVYFFDDSSKEFMHTMKGDLLAKIETVNI